MIIRELKTGSERPVLAHGPIQLFSRFFPYWPSFFPFQNLKTLQNIAHHLTCLFYDFNLKNIIPMFLCITILPELSNGVRKLKTGSERPVLALGLIQLFSRFFLYWPCFFSVLALFEEQY